MTNVIAVFQIFRCFNGNKFFRELFNLERRLTTCSERVKKVYPKMEDQIRETFFDKMASFALTYTRDYVQKLFKTLALFEFESICVPRNFLKTQKEPR